ncbi:hypothetical protein GCM10025865_14570 [Paraoerskovia sediminicola]|uniref:Type II toxin-antitoxin system HicA family toxin n=1 Tax=Paraoerskovia sediminicola TaxID=1138587 RepID=A0ABN6XFA1_9CELL|nr:hypothetical protein GCM10025865_14570 [Paraoerskovia sediminicola]
MISPKPTREVVKDLRRAGFEPGRTRGSHTRWAHPCGVQVTVPDGHRMISPGVLRQIQAAIKEAR